MKKEKKRLDTLLQERFPECSRRFIQSIIMQGKVTHNGIIFKKPGVLVPININIKLSLKKQKYVSRAGFKLEKALDHFQLDVTGLIALDAGISTGGFTDCLLQRGVLFVYGIDVAHGHVHEKIAHDERLFLLERTNIRYPLPLSRKVNIVTLDLSFISLCKVINTVTSCLKKGGILITLIKPQFEAGRERVGRGGIVKNPRVHQEVINRIVSTFKKHGFTHKGLVLAPHCGTRKNKEFLSYFIFK